MRQPHWTWETPPDEAYVRTVDGAPVAILRLFHRRLLHMDVSLPVVGIGGVFTVEGQRGKGHASALLAHTLGDLSRRGYLAACLYASHDRSLYQRAGFVEVQLGFWCKALATGLAFVERDMRLLRMQWTVEPDGHF